MQFKSLALALVASATVAFASTRSTSDCSSYKITTSLKSIGEVTKTLQEGASCEVSALKGYASSIESIKASKASLQNTTEQINATTAHIEHVCAHAAEHFKGLTVLTQDAEKVLKQVNGSDVGEAAQSIVTFYTSVSSAVEALQPLAPMVADLKTAIASFNSGEQGFSSALSELAEGDKELKKVYGKVEGEIETLEGMLKNVTESKQVKTLTALVTELI